MTPLQKLREVCSKRTPGKWVGVNVHGYCHTYEDGNVPIGGMRNNAFVEAASEHFETLIEIAEASKNYREWHRIGCPYCNRGEETGPCYCAHIMESNEKLDQALAKLDGRGDGP